MKVVFLGTGTSQGVPVIACNCEVCSSTNLKDKRLRSSIHIEINSLSIVIDSGPDFRSQLLRTNIKNLDAILYTHEHKDHTAGLDDVRPFNFKYKKSIPIYAEQRVLDSLKSEFSYIFSNYPGVPQLELNSINNQEFDIQGVNIIPIRVKHRELPILGYRIRDFAYITDASFIEDEELKKLKGIDTLVLNAVRKEPHHSHFNLEEALDLFNKVKPKKGYITHISHQMGLHDEVNKELPNNIKLAYDELTLNFN